MPSGPTAGISAMWPRRRHGRREIPPQRPSCRAREPIMRKLLISLLSMLLVSSCAHLPPVDRVVCQPPPLPDARLMTDEDYEQQIRDSLPSGIQLPPSPSADTQTRK